MRGLSGARVPAEATAPDPALVAAPAVAPPLAPETAAEVLQLQRLAGNAAVARVLSRPQRPVLARLRLDSGQVLSAVESIPFMKKKLGESLRGEEMRAQVDRALKRYEDLHGAAHRGRTNTGVMLAIALDGVARVIAEQLYDPAIQGELAVQLFTLYEGDIKATTGVDGGADESLGLAKVLVGDDPLALYMHNELRIEVAAQRIRDMATDVADETGEEARSADRMFDLLRHKWEAQMAAHSPKDIKEETGLYSVKEATGELSRAYLKKLFGDVAEAPEKPGGHGLQFTPEAQKKLDDLRAEVKHPSAPVDMNAFAPRFAGMTAKQERHLREVEGRDAAASVADAKKALAKAVASNVGISAAEAAPIADDIDRWLQSVPLTITVWGSRWFDKGVPAGVDTRFKPATKQTKSVPLADLFEKPGTVGAQAYTGKYDDPHYGKERGERYLRFRTWKDRLMTGLLDFDTAELPTFGAANVNWERMRGTVEGGKTKEGEIPAGQNYYGDTHFLLKNEVRNRAVYTATDHGAPHRNPLLAALDFVQGESLTGLSSPRKTLMVMQLVDAARTKALNIRGELPFEIQIFGGVDIARDVQTIYYAPGVSDNVKTNIASFSATTGVGHEQLASIKDKATIVDVRMSDLKPGIQEELLEAAGEHGQPEGLDDYTRAARLQALTILRLQVATDDDVKVLRSQLLSLSGSEHLLEPHVAERVKRLKSYIDTHFPEV